MEKGRGWDGAVSTSNTARKQEPLFRLSAERLGFLFRKESIFLLLDPQALLDIYLLDNIDEAAKHAIVSLNGAMCISPPPLPVFH